MRRARFANASACYMHSRSGRADRAASSATTKGSNVNIQLALAPIIALIAGILILIRPRLLNYIVAIYLIVVGILGLVGYR